VTEYDNTTKSLLDVKVETNYTNLIEDLLDHNHNHRHLDANASIEDFEKQYEAAFDNAP